MSLMDEEERREVLAKTDVFFMAKIMREKKFDMEVISHHDKPPSEMIKICMLHVQEKYPYFKIRPSKNDDDLFIFTVTLPTKYQSRYAEVKKKFDKMFNGMECHYGEIFTKWHYNEFHVQAVHNVLYHDLLRDLLKVCKEIEEKEVSA